MRTAEDATRDFDSLFNAYYRQLARLLYRVAGYAERAEDAAAEAFWRLYRSPPPAIFNLEGWLYRTGVRIALDRLKTERRRADDVDFVARRRAELCRNRSRAGSESGFRGKGDWQGGAGISKGVCEAVWRTMSGRN
jgi:DNA-directed RNA polymerase specialized sigma24 family protein